ncbi:ArsR family transcriptional regulator [Mycobacterium sp.]|jgi:protein-tyrosine-phosphatase|uniref:arsenate reductase/protein-tyrosine-phosphatase family protein n=1 Tax=Mycobacterium sp. TaxID=1785 RepID=UPI002C6A9176|nr:ArsR family transcriptional regulator [Mycobacterium sp.]HTH92763.1 ArsR family transcriptional regulator [Mycobacterium sp.]
MATEANTRTVTRTSIYAALADPGRLAIVDRLSLGDASPSELQALLSMPSNLIAHHLNVLQKANVTHRARSEGDHRRMYVSLNSEALESILPSPVRPAVRVVFVCTQNSARSQLAVAIWHRHSRLPATSAGTHPVSEIQPGALAAARRHQLPMQARTPLHLNNVLAPGDLAVVVCDRAHEELPGELRRIHWSIPDPVRASTPEAFDRTIESLTKRIVRLVPILQSSRDGANQ